MNQSTIEGMTHDEQVIEQYRKICHGFEEQFVEIV